MFLQKRYLIILILFFISCSKSDPLTDKKLLIAGSKGGHKVWQLSSLTIDGQSLRLGTSQLNFQKTFYFDGTYTDSDAHDGIWKLDSPTDLLEVYYNLPTGLLFQKYSDMAVTPNLLILNYLLDGQHVTTTYTSVK
jgi:hypothetical protein